MLLEVIEERWQDALEDVEGVLAHAKAQRAVQKLIGGLVHLLEDAVVSIMVVVVLLGVLREPVVEHLEDDFVLVLGVLVVQDGEAVEMDGEQREVVAHLGAVRVDIENLQRDPHRLHVAPECFVGQLHEGQWSPLDFRSEDGAAVQHAEHGVEEVDERGEARDDQEHEGQGLCGAESRQRVKRRTTCRQHVQREATDPVVHAP
mmetsp:Transcript_24506/g.68295  ORF Transcript_24506/g.68295 Transcript_24506/m.68295 type:complete len:203 (+) Transcript_24506:628-1236(+)